MLDKLQAVFQVLRDAKLTLKPSKCNFGALELDYLGFRISKGIVQLGRKVTAIENYTTPSNEHEVRQFLELPGFVHGYAVLTAPITALTKKDVRFLWAQEQERAFSNLKTLLGQQSVLQMYSPSATVTQIHKDASANGLPGMLMKTYILSTALVNL